MENFFVNLRWIRYQKSHRTLHMFSWPLTPLSSVSRCGWMITIHEQGCCCWCCCCGRQLARIRCPNWVFISAIRSVTTKPDIRFREESAHTGQLFPTLPSIGAAGSFATVVFNGSAHWRRLANTIERLISLPSFIAWNDVTDSMVTIRSLFCGYNLA